VRGNVNGRIVRLPVSVHKLGKTAQNPDAVLGLLFARSKVTAIEETLWDRDSRAAEKEIVELGERFKLVTRFTSLVAVDRSRTLGGGSPDKVVQPLEGPEGVDLDMAGGRDSSAQRGRRVVIQSSSVEIIEKKGEGSGGGLSGVGSAAGDEGVQKPKNKSPSGRAPAAAPAKPAPTAAAPPPPQAPPVAQSEPPGKDDAPAPAEAAPSEPKAEAPAANANEENGYGYEFQDQSAHHESLRSPDFEGDAASDDCARDPEACEALKAARSSKEDGTASHEEGRVERGDRGCGCGIPARRANPAFALLALAMLGLFVLRRRGRG
jgi:hypothetical protein